MKPIGVPRISDIESPDVADGRQYGIKPSKLNYPGKGGDIRSNFKNPDKKQAARRYYARIDRAAGKEDIKQQLSE